MRHKQKEPEFDQYCPHIFLALAFEGEMRFNQLYRFLEKEGIQLSRPSFRDHLQHLTEKGLVERDEEDIQYVTYRLNRDKFRKMPEVVKRNKEILAKIDMERKDFDSRPIDKQFEDVLRLLVFKGLIEMELEIGDMNYYEKLVATHHLKDRVYNRILVWFTQNCLKDEKKREEALKMIASAKSKVLRENDSSYTWEK